MPGFAIPELPRGYDLQWFYLGIRGDFGFSAEDYEKIRRDAGISKKNQHVGFTQTVDLAGRSAELRGTIGVHDLRGIEAELDLAAGEPPPTDAWVHYALSVELTSKPEETTEGDWDAAYVAVRNLLPERVPMSVILRMSVPSGKIDPAVSLPISLGKTAVSGFSEIRGVRLAEADPDDPDEELYSLIIDQSGDTTSIQVFASVETPCDEHVLLTALDRALAVTELAIRKVNGE